jgi:hypothetical protein
LLSVRSAQGESVSARALVLPSLSLLVSSFAYVWVLRQDKLTTTLTMVWSALVTASFCGWGRLWSRVVLPGVRISWPLAGAVGIGLYCVVGGVLLALGIVSRGLLLVLVASGLLATCVLLGPPRRSPLRALRAFVRRVRTRWPLWLCGAFVVFWLGKRVLWASELFDYNINDDFTAYFTYPRRMLDTGAFNDPFSFRRLGAYGGQSFLHALFLAGTGDPYRLQVFDTGVCELLVAGMLLVYARRNATAKAAALLGCLLLITLPNLRINAASAMSGVVLIAAVVQVYEAVVREQRLLSRGAAVTIGLLAAALCTLRQSYLATAAPLLAVLFLGNLFAAKRGEERRGGWIALGSAAAACVLGLAPWGLVAHVSSGSFLFPLVKGNFNPAYVLSGYDKLEQFGARLWSQIGYVEGVRTLPLFALAGLLAIQAKIGFGYMGLVLSSIVGFVAIVAGFPVAPHGDAARYYFANAVVLGVFTVPVIGAALHARRPAMRLPFLLAVLALVFHLHEIKDISRPGYTHSGTLDADGLVDLHRKEYQAAQQAIPAGEGILAMVEKPFWFDFGRNNIDLVDVPGAASPPPGAPYLEGPEKLRRYLLQRKIRYVVYIRFEIAQDLYRRDQWVSMSGPGTGFFQTLARYSLAAMDSIEAFSRQYRRVFQGERLVVVDLGSEGP